MLLSKFVEKLQGIRSKYGDIQICLALAEVKQYVLLEMGDINVKSDVYVVEDNEDLVAAYEEGNKTVVLGNL